MTTITSIDDCDGNELSGPVEIGGGEGIGEGMGGGQGMGEGQGQGERPEAESDAQFWDTRVRQKMQMGETVYGGKVGGDNRKGTTMVEVQEMVLTSITEDPEALDDTPLPKNQRDHTRGYFDSIRKATK